MDHRLVEVTVRVSPGANQLLAFLHKQHVKLTQLQVTEHQLIFRMNKKDLPVLRQARRYSKAKLTLSYMNQQAVLQRTIWTVVGLFLCVIVPIIASQFIWRVEVAGGTPELIQEVSEYLEQELQVKQPIRAKQLPTEMDIRQQLMATFPDLAWVHFYKQAGDIQITLQLAPKTEMKQVQERTHLIAKTAGVVTHHFLTAGKLVVETNATVYEGDLLASGIIGENELSVVTGASGEVFADYWLETSFTMPRQMKYYTSNEGKWTVVQDVKPATQEMALPKWLKKYARVVKRQSYTLHERVLEEADLEAVILPLLQYKLLQSKPAKTTIKSEKVLHLSIDNDTVKGQVLYLVNENIAQPIPIEQGD